MKHVLKWYWLFSGFIHKYFLGISLGLIVGVIAFTQGPKLLKYIPVKQTVHIGRVGAFTLSTIPLDIQQKVSRGLTQISTDGQVELDLAETMSVTEDGTAYTLTLDPNARWSTGEPIVSNDLQLSLKDIQVGFPSNQTVTFTLPEPYAPFLSILSQPVMKKVTEGKIFKKTRIVGVNDYSITNVTTQNQFIQSLTLSSKNTTIVYRFYPTEQEALTAYKAGHIDQIEKLSTPYLNDWSNTEVLQDDSTNRYLALFFNTANSTLQDKTIRQLLTYAAPKFEDRGRVISPIDENSWVYNPQVKPYHQSLQTAQTMLEKLQSSNNTALVLELTTTPAYTDEAQKIIEAWQSIGVETKLKIVSFPDPNDYQVLLIGQQIPDDPDQYALWHSTQSTNITHYQNAKIDKLLEDGRKERDPEKRKQIYQDFQRFLVEDNPVAFLHELPTYTLKRR